VHEEDHVVVRALGELDAASSVRLRRLLADLIRLRTNAITVDMSGVEFMDSSGLGALLANRVAADGLGVGFGLVNPSRQVARVLEITGTYDRLVS
jgi:anti-sigma B factor antagonist